jgi:hypothetical protein
MARSPLGVAMGVSGAAHLQGLQVPSSARHQPLPVAPVASTQALPSEHVHEGPTALQSPSGQASTPQLPTPSAIVEPHGAGCPPMQVSPVGQSASPKHPSAGGVRQVPGVSLAQAAE